MYNGDSHISQGKGYGNYLLLQSLLQLKRSGLSKIGITVDPNNSRALHIYCDKFGFKYVEIKAGVFRFLYPVINPGIFCTVYSSSGY
jgi:ribosomal protein S18 acetylase RimI-like enzyme